jgi:hypothetical protein
MQQSRMPQTRGSSRWTQAAERNLSAELRTSVGERKIRQTARTVFPRKETEEHCDRQCEGRDELGVLPSEDGALCEAEDEEQQTGGDEQDAWDIEAAQQRVVASVGVAEGPQGLGHEPDGQEDQGQDEHGEEAKEPFVGGLE